MTRPKLLPDAISTFRRQWTEGIPTVVMALGNGSGWVTRRFDWWHGRRGCRWRSIPGNDPDPMCGYRDNRASPKRATFPSGGAAIAGELPRN